MRERPIRLSLPNRLNHPNTQLFKVAGLDTINHRTRKTRETGSMANLQTRQTQLEVRGLGQRQLLHRKPLKQQKRQQKRRKQQRKRQKQRRK